MKTQTTPDTIADMIDAGQYNEATEQALKAAGVTLALTQADQKPAPWDDGQYRPHWRATLKSKTGRTTVDFWDSVHAGQNGKQATPYDVVSCLQWSDPGTFEEFCGEFGEDMDSRKAEKTWKACRAQFLALGRVVINEQDRAALAAIR